MINWVAVIWELQVLYMWYSHLWSCPQRFGNYLFSSVWDGLFSALIMTLCHGNDFRITSPLWSTHDDVIKWEHFPRYWPFVREIHRSPVNFPHKGQWRGTLMFTLICARMNGWVNNREAGDLRRYRVHYDVIVMQWFRALNVFFRCQPWKSCWTDLLVSVDMRRMRILGM